MIPGELFVASGDIELNAGRKTRKLVVSNAGDRPVQVGSHYHFFETNPALRFDRAAARGWRLNIAAGTAVRFEPGQERTVELVELTGARIVYGFNGLVMGALDGKDARKTRQAHKTTRVTEQNIAVKKAAVKKTAKEKAVRKAATRTAPKKVAVKSAKRSAS